MDDFGNQARLGLLHADSFPCAHDDFTQWPLTGATTVGVAMIPGGQVERRQQRDGARLCQTVDVRRCDGSVWTAYTRQYVLPTDPGAADRATEQASSVLGLLAQAVAAADTARQARGAMLEWDVAPPPWMAHYG